MSCKKIAVFKDEVTMRVHTIKVWQFWLYFVNCWFLCNQTQMVHHHEPASLVTCEKIKLLCSRLKSRQRFRLYWMLVLRFLYWYWSLGNQSKYVGVLLLITRPDANRVGIYMLTITQICNIYRHTVGGILLCMVTNLVYSVLCLWTYNVWGHGAVWLWILPIIPQTNSPTWIL